MDYIYNFSNDWFGNIKIKIMLNINNIFFNKKILIYGLGKSGLSAYQYLKKHNTLYLFDDQKKIIQNKKIKKRLIKYKSINKNKFDRIILSPGIDINKCKLSFYNILFPCAIIHHVFPPLR